MFFWGTISFPELLKMVIERSFPYTIFHLRRAHVPISAYEVRKGLFTQSEFLSYRQSNGAISLVT